MNCDTHEIQSFVTCGHINATVSIGLSLLAKCTTMLQSGLCSLTEEEMEQELNNDTVL